jgi:hypothetical protein
MRAAASSLWPRPTGCHNATVLPPLGAPLSDIALTGRSISLSECSAAFAVVAEANRNATAAEPW